ncbi:MAG TPA: protein kinase [Polyangiaceae bacterium]|nr:MAG: Tyrosine-protein kinase MasK [Deltaproteobacteria bacterium ADurb.Bin207]HNS99966.1 protein kinase [Polyangiaceae bacterium]HNZ22406.1 protein kinase [Polyangiaceae bacterium]HOD20941.1 protein kinase [Polyangiaceae bacterium]HOE48299.1 protein kinase [Polyangiaceae bacterium]
MGEPSEVGISEVTNQRVERYELLAELAAGGMATVYLARLGGAGGFQRLYAIKKLHPHFAHEREFVEMFLDEARLAARIHHPNVVPILEVGQSQSGFFLVMEYIEGETLARLLGRTSLREERIPPRVGAKIVLDVLAGLEAAHSLVDDFGKPLHIVHRDVSPQNVMVGLDGTSRITDFGVARAATRISTTRAGQLKGKVGYMAPEQARGDDIDSRADVFSVGVILWETLAGRRLFKNKPDAPDTHTLQRLLHEPIPTLRDIAPGTPEAIERVCFSALERDPDRRVASCGAFAEALEAAMMQSCGVASAREVAAFVESVAGPELEQQREAVRNWVSRSDINVLDPHALHEPSAPTPSRLTSPFVLQNPTPKTPPPRTTNLPLILVSVAFLLLAIAFVGVVILFLRETSPTHNASIADSSAYPAASSTSATETAAPSPCVSASVHPPDVQPAETSSVTRSTPKRDRSPSTADAGKSETTTNVEEPVKPTTDSLDDLDTNPYRP